MLSTGALLVLEFVKLVYIFFFFFFMYIVYKNSKKKNFCSENMKERIYSISMLINDIY